MIKKYITTNYVCRGQKAFLENYFDYVYISTIHTMVLETRKLREESSCVRAGMNNEQV